MQFAPGSSVGSFKIQSLLGVGGMGEVYLALDTRLGRDVALKILPESLAHDPERKSRFEREARVLASLNHPNIATLHGLREFGDRIALEMELVPGETLAERIQRSPMPVDEILSVFRQIAQGLEAAHERGIIHRDLKPSNIKVLPDGRVKILDFGLAKALEADLDRDRTGFVDDATSSRSKTGMIMGTARYMSPEQARGKPLDRRTDIWSYGCVLYEALAGRSPFVAETGTDILAAILKEEPDWNAIAKTPPGLQRLVRRCLRKDPQTRLRDIADARLDIDEIVNDSAALRPIVAPEPESRVPARGLLIGAGIGAAVVGLFAIPALWLTRPEPAVSGPAARVAIPLAADERVAAGPAPSIAISPDGRKIAYLSSKAGGRTQVVLRTLDRFDAAPVAGTEGASAPFFSPDGTWIGYYAADAIQKVSLDGGAPLKLCDAPPISGAAWLAGGIVFSTTLPGDGLWRVPADGGAPEKLTQPDAKQRELHHLYPQPIPGEAGVVFLIRTDQGAWGASLDVDSKQWKRLQAVRPSGGGVLAAASGHLVYAQPAGLAAIPFKASTGETEGSQIPIAERVAASPDEGTAFAVSANGTLVYLPGQTAMPRRTLVSVDRDGRAAPLTEQRAAYVQPRYSPDGRWIAVTIETETGADVWLQDLQRGTRTRLTTGGATGFPAWTPDAKDVAFHASRWGPWSLYARAADGSRQAEPLLTGARPDPAAAWSHDPAEKMLPGSLPTLSGANPQYPMSWTNDGKTLAFTEQKPNGERDIWTFEKGTDPTPFLMTAADESSPAFSPNGQWIAYVSNEASRSDVYVQPYPGPGGRWLVSTNGGTDPVWSKDGRELFYLQDESVMVVGVTTSAAGFTAGTPTRLFEGRYESSVIGRNFDLAPDGKRFVMVRSDDVQPTARLHVILNWLDELKQRVPTR